MISWSSKICKAKKTMHLVSYISIICISRDETHKEWTQQLHRTAQCCTTCNSYCSTLKFQPTIQVYQISVTIITTTSAFWAKLTNHPNLPSVCHSFASALVDVTTSGSPNPSEDLLFGLRLSRPMNKRWSKEITILFSLMGNLGDWTYLTATADHDM